MIWTPIEKSSAISQVGYDLKERRLIIQSLNGTPYEYLNVPPEAHQAFLAAPSKGKAWAEVKKTYALKADPARPAVPKPAARPAVKAAPEAVTEIIVASHPTFAIAFEAGTDTVGFPALPFDQMVQQLKSQMDRHFEALVIEIDNLAKRATLLTVIDEASYTTAAELCKQLTAKRKYVTELIKPTKQAIDSVKSVVLGKEKELLVLAQAGEDRLDRICTDYRVAEKRRANEAAEAERKRLLKEAEDKRIADAEKAQAAGRTKLADALLSTPVTAPRVEVQTAVPKVEGVSARVNWKWLVTDIAKVPDEFWILDEVAIGQRVRADKDKTAIPGIEAYPEDKTNFRG